MVLGVARRLGLGARLAVVDQRLDQLGAARLERLLGGARLRLVAEDLDQADGCAAAASRIAIITPLPQKRLPFLRRCQRSSAARPSVSAVAASRSGAPATRSSSVKMRSALSPIDLVGGVAEQALGAAVPAR